jgi:GNAT superfamily N-acetyltransferase
VTGVAVPTLNGVWVGSVDVDAGLVSDLLDLVAGAGLPYCLQARPEAGERLMELVAARGMTVDHEIPLMVLDAGNSPLLGEAQSRDGLVIRELKPDEAPEHARVAAEAFGVPVELFLQLTTPTMLATPGVRCYLGEHDGEAATTGLGVTIGFYVALFNIATPPAHRRQGLAAAITARAVADGFAAGATWAWLQSSEAGYRIYEQLGFRTVANWHCWVAKANT